MTGRTALSVLLVVLALLGGTLVSAVGASPSQPSIASADGSFESKTGPLSVTDQHPPDPETDVLGWEDGYWYNETIDVTPEDGLNDSELDAVVARGMARVEEIRQLEFEETPPVEVISRDAYSKEVTNRTSNTTDARRLHQNVKYEALLMVDESTDATEIQADNRAGGVGGYYDPSTGEIRIVSENGTTPKMDEVTLAQELFHALQDQHFDLGSFDQSTRERHNAVDGIVEGDGNYVDHLYQERCDGEWAGTCVVPSASETPSSSGFEPHWGLYQILLQPYSDGPAFVQGLHESAGWEAVNDVYETPPASTEQTIHPEKYDVDEPANVSVPDRSGDDWRVLEIDGGVNYASFGEAGLYVTLWYPAIATEGGPSILSLRDHFNYGPDGQLQALDPYDYNHRYTAGWDGDKLVPYVADESFETNETGYVYKTVWDSPEDAAEFQDAYEQLLSIHEAQPVEGHVNTYRIPSDDGFGDAFYLNQSAETFTIVNAPSVEELPEVYDGAAPAGDGTTTTGSGFTALIALAVIVVVPLVGD